MVATQPGNAKKQKNLNLHIYGKQKNNKKSDLFPISLNVASINLYTRYPSNQIFQVSTCCRLCV